MEIPVLIAAALPWLFILACPLMMWWMMRGMNCQRQQSSEEGAPASANAGEEIRSLKARIAQLEADREKTGTWS